MRKKMERLAKLVEENIGDGMEVRFTENPVNVQEHGRYFMQFANSFGVFRIWDTQAEAIEDLEDILENGFWCNGQYYGSNY